jgi:hypothetical protein
MRSVGVLMTFGADEAIGQTRVAALLQGLQQAGWEVGRNLRIELRWSGANPGDVVGAGEYRDGISSPSGGPVPVEEPKRIDVLARYALTCSCKRCTVIGSLVSTP